MTAAPERSPAPLSGPDPFRHLAVVHDDADELVTTLAPLLDAARAQHALVWAAVDGPIRRAVERYLGDAAEDVVFSEPAQPYSYSGQTTAARRAERLREMVDVDRGALILSDTSTIGGSGPDASPPDVWSVVDASCNLALTGLPVTLVCLCAAAGASEASERFRYWNHPELFVGATASPNPRYRLPEDVLAAFPAPPAPVLGPPDHETAFDGVGALRAIRQVTRHRGEDAGLDDDQVDGLVLAIAELVSNSIEHGAGRGTMSWWTRPGRIVAEIHDVGHMTTTTPGLRRPSIRSPRGRGVWLARQLSDVLHLWTGDDGTHVRLELSA
ncbi:anti-sigma regulatory factor [Actinomycetospora sp. NBRC 106375]|uniref:ATP-binding protein n=1 Tax=Actinomycetospora sp. NBRC 106375 TaxID=3032207 RepID=UPI00249FB666|nr:ATP-binding protein [Actinomycetospora sp. NBRC 106375]GLZ46404.1 anti-sigma regulatory factor [Actinomycetospora sp. NBRC 106375]